MSFRPLLGLLVQPLHVGLELAPIDTPDPTTPDLDGRKLTGANQRVHLRDADRQVNRHVVEGQKTRLYLGSTIAGATGIRSGHRPTIAPDHDRYLHLASFAAVCCHWVRRGVPCR